MKKILVPCDFSDTSVQAFRFAIDIADKAHGEIHLLHVLELPALYDPAAVLEFEQTYMNDARALTEKKFSKLREKWASGFTRIKIHIKFGSLQTCIRQVVDSANIDLIVAGTNGAKGIKEFTVGSNAEKLVRLSDVPVIVVRKAPKEVKNIVFPTLADMSQEELTMKVKSLQDFFDAKLHILYVNTPAMFRRSGEIHEAFNKFTKRFMIKNCEFHVYDEYTEEAGIINFSKEIKADLVAMRTHGRRGIAHLASGSIAEDVVNHIDCPIVTYKIN